MRIPLVVPVLCVALGVAAGIGACSSSNSGSGYPTAPPASGPSFNLGFPAKGSSQSFTFVDAGSWDYHCAPHQLMGMTGTVIVSAGATADSDTVAVGVDGSGVEHMVFTPSSVTIKPNGHVRWVNRSTSPVHTVTRL